VLQTYGNTAAEMRQGESLDRQIAAEVPESTEEALEWRPEPGQARQVGAWRAGRLVAASGLGDEAGSATLAEDVGIDGGGASAEEAAMHIIDLADQDDEED